MSERAQCWINGRLMPGSEASISVFDHGLLYGDGVFEGIRFYQGKAFRLQEHLQRLMDSAAAIRLTVPCAQETLTEAVDDIIAAFAELEGYIRLIVTRGAGPLGLNPEPCTHPNVILIADRLSMIDERQRRQAGADEAVLLNQNGYVAEGSAENIFIVRNHLFTPQPTDGALQGVTRGVVMALAAGDGLPVTACALTPYDLYTADECFLTGTGAELIPVREVDGRPLPYCPGPVFSRLAEAFADRVARETLAG